MNNRHHLIILLPVMLLSACAQFTPYRTEIPDAISADLAFKCKVDESEPELVDKDMPGTALELCDSSKSAGSQAIQHRYYQAWHEPKVKGKERTRMTGDYHLSFVEFDDQGWFADRGQMEALFELLKTLEEKNDRDTLIYVYAHGWKHNASACDNNVVCFSRLLERTDLIEQIRELAISGKGRRNVVGVYLGWRGLPFDGVLNNLSFWSRKDTAARVGRGGVFELLTRLKDYRDSRQKDFRDSTLKYDCVSELNKAREGDSNSQGTINLLKERPDCAKHLDVKELPPQPDQHSANTQLVITGHSFGGLIIYEALSHALMERAAKTKVIDDEDCTAKGCSNLVYDVAESFGDFVMLVNPAFEGSLYEPLFHIATNRCYDAKQRPVMMIVTSEADSATRVAFPVGRTLSTLLQHATSPDQSQSMRQAIGHNPRYETHQLESDGVVQEGVADDSPCPCGYLEATSNVDVTTKLMPLFKTSLDNLIKKILDDRRVGIGEVRSPKFNPRRYGKGVMLVPVPGGECYSIADDRFRACADKKSEEDLSECYIEDRSFQECVAEHGQSSPRYASRYPYLVVSTDSGVIGDHNAIYNERFLDFQMTFITEHISQAEPWEWPPGASARNCPPTKGGLLPSGQSCWLGEDKSCSVSTLPAQ